MHTQNHGRVPEGTQLFPLRKEMNSRTTQDSRSCTNSCFRKVNGKTILSYFERAKGAIRESVTFYTVSVKKLVGFVPLCGSRPEGLLEGTLYLA